MWGKLKHTLATILAAGTIACTNTSKRDSEPAGRIDFTQPVPLSIRFDRDLPDQYKQRLLSELSRQDEWPDAINFKVVDTQTVGRYNRKETDVGNIAHNLKKYILPEGGFTLFVTENLLDFNGIAPCSPKNNPVRINFKAHGLMHARRIAMAADTIDRTPSKKYIRNILNSRAENNATNVMPDGSYLFMLRHEAAHVFFWHTFASGVQHEKFNPENNQKMVPAVLEALIEYEEGNNSMKGYPIVHAESCLPSIDLVDNLNIGNQLFEAGFAKQARQYYTLALEKSKNRSIQLEAELSIRYLDRIENNSINASKATQ